MVKCLRCKGEMQKKKQSIRVNGKWIDVMLNHCTNCFTATYTGARSERVIEDIKAAFPR